MTEELLNIRHTSANLLMIFKESIQLEYQSPISLCSGKHMRNVNIKWYSAEWKQLDGVTYRISFKRSQMNSLQLEITQLTN